MDLLAFGRSRWWLFFLCLLSATILLQARDRETAREAFQKAGEYHRSLIAQPTGSRTLSKYQQSIYLYRLVVDADPTYGACDDALFAIAQLYDEMATRFQRDTYRKRAIYYYNFVARDYPLTRHKAAALSRSAALGKTPGPAKGTSAPASSPPNEPPLQAGVEAPAFSETAPEPTGDQPPRDPLSLATLSEVRYWSNEEYTRVVLQLDREIGFRKEVLSNPNRIYFDLQEARVDREIVNDSYDVNGLFIKKIRVAENRSGVVRVVLDFEEINQHTVFALYDPFRIVIDTRGGARTPPPPPSSPLPVVKAPDPKVETVESGSVGDAPSDVAPSPTIQGNWTLTRTLGLKVGRVVLDPGHGGKDTGTIGPSGLREKDLVLSVALRLRDLLHERLGTEVILTREDDRFVPLEERTAIANQKGADLFVSIHANASRNKKASGVETYVLDFATSPAEIEAATRENATSQRNIRELEDLLRKIALGDFNQESRDLAHSIQTGLLQGLQENGNTQKNRGIKQAPFIVLIGSNMPSILTEIGFISNSRDEKFLRREESHQQVAEALFQGIESYFRKLGTAAAPSGTASTSER